jgi:serine/threonine protein kinase
MSLAPGERIGQFEILEQVGAGGMGEVYRARDTKLKRDVALKVLLPAFARDPERYARFQREAEVLASLNHSNIATLYGMVDDALVMEFVEGSTLPCPLPFDAAVKYARQIAEALEYAHERGVIHRDLKPANVKVTPEGAVKVLDFGLAKALDNTPVPGSSSPTNSPTLTLGHTIAGQILGTAAYMSPEQVEGISADRRADVWSFGAVLFEMLAGRRAFEGSTNVETLAAVMRLEPDWTGLPESTPGPVVSMIRRCLTKDRRQRLQAIGEARIMLERPLETPSGAESPAQPEGRLTSKSKLPWVLAAVLAVAAIGLGYVAYKHSTEEVRVVRSSLLTPEKAQFNTASALPAISPDGRRVAFAPPVDGQVALWVRDLDGLSARQLPGTAGAKFPFWSPDSRWIGFFTDAKLKKIDVNGGPALTVCDVAEGRGGTWNHDDVIVYGRLSAGLFKVAAAGGVPIALNKVDQEYDRVPWFLPDNRHFLYMARSSNREEMRVYVDSIDAKPGVNTRREVVAADSNAAYANGYLLFVRERTLMAQPFDAGKAKTTGDAVPLAEEIDYLPNGNQGQFSVSQNGVLVYTSGAGGGGRLQLTWLDRTGKSLGTVWTPGDIGAPALSPDGATVAVQRLDSAGVADIWLYDLARGTPTRFTFGPSPSLGPVWSPDGNRIAFSVLRGNGVGGPYQKPASGVGKEEPLDQDPQPHRVEDWSRDGRFVFAQTVNSKTGNDIWVFPQFGDRKPYPYLNTEFRETHARLSPNGNWLAYLSDESKRPEVYVQTFPEHGGKWQVSTGGGIDPVWSRDGRELYFIAGDRNKMMAVEVTGNGAKFEPGIPKPLFDVSGPTGFDVSKDGRFLMLAPVEQAAPNVPITVVTNWPAGLRR